MISRAPNLEGGHVQSAQDDGERALAEKRAATALRLQRKQRLQAMVLKRKTNLAYLKRVHLGGCYWLNVALFNKDLIDRYIASVVPKTRADSFFHLGLSVARLFELYPAGLPIVRAFAQLMEEWEYHFSGTIQQGVKFMMAKNSSCIHPQSSHSGHSNLASTAEISPDSLRSSVYKFNSNVVYEHLVVTHIPFELDYVQVVVSLFDCLERIYSMMMHEDTYTHIAVYDVAVRLDARIKHHIVNAIAKELTDVAQRQLHTQTFSLRTLLNGFSGVAQKLKKRDHDDHHDKHSGKGRNKSDREGGSFFRKGTARSRSGTPTTISASGVVVEDTSIPLKDIPSSGLSSNAVPFHGGATDADTLPDDESVDEEEEAEGQL